VSKRALPKAFDPEGLFERHLQQLRQFSQQMLELVKTDDERSHTMGMIAAYKLVHEAFEIYKREYIIEMKNYQSGK